jgi:YgiT-type zinc finger domain-containing protein
MKCVVCKTGNTQPGRTSVTIERGGTTLVFKAVPAEVCDNCGEAYVSEEVSRQILASAEHAAQSGVQVEVQDFAGAAT